MTSSNRWVISTGTAAHQSLPSTSPPGVGGGVAVRLEADRLLDEADRAVGEGEVGRRWCGALRNEVHVRPVARVGCCSGRRPSAALFQRDRGGAGGRVRVHGQPLWTFIDPMASPIISMVLPVPSVMAVHPAARS